MLSIKNQRVQFSHKQSLIESFTTNRIQVIVANEPDTLGHCALFSPSNTSDLDCITDYKCCPPYHTIQCPTGFVQCHCVSVIAFRSVIVTTYKCLYISCINSMKPLQWSIVTLQFSHRITDEDKTVIKVMVRWLLMDLINSVLICTVTYLVTFYHS